MNTLGIDCSFAGLSLGLGVGARVYERGIAEARASDKLLPLLQELLREAGLTAADVGRVLVTIGPGSFTGIRLGLAVAEGLKLVHPALQVAGVPTLVALAAGVVRTQKSGTPFTLLLDAAGGMVYRQDFDAAGKPLAGPVCEALAGLKGLQPFVAAQAGLLPPFPTQATLTGVAPATLLALAADEKAWVEARPFYLKPLTYKASA
jgi:tRNA threonylcarbamoyladenosine biosynthesis protein TsaB